MAQPFSTLVELVQYRAKTAPEGKAYIYLKDGQNEEEILTYGELDLRARKIAALLSHHTKPGDRALINHLPGLDYISAFFGCLYAGVVAVPVYPPRYNSSLDRIKSIVSDGTARLALTSESIYESLKPLLAESGELTQVKWLTTDSELPEETFVCESVSADDLAFIQYTSGSTSDPKGVMLSHQNLLTNMQVITDLYQVTENSRAMVWLPPYHDMGLIGGILVPLLEGFPMVLISPYSFLMRPARWLQAITKYKVTHTGAPNFAYELCVKRVSEKQMAELDLSSWELAFCGAEPIQMEVLNAFADKFGAVGFNQNALYPCYGLAEATLLVTGAEKSKGVRSIVVQSKALEEDKKVEESDAVGSGTRTLVSSGQVPKNHLVKVVDPKTLRVLPDGEVGEVWFAGPSVAKGYWGRPDQSKETFEAELELYPGIKFLRTGDLGFSKEGEIYITGRIKDLIILRGRNIYPQDIELTVAKAHPALKPGATAAFSVGPENQLKEGQKAQGEQLVIVQELDRKAKNVDLSEVEQSIKDEIFREHNLNLDALSLIKANSIPLTTSGKIKRRACKNQFLQGGLSELFRNPAPNPNGVTLQ